MYDPIEDLKNLLVPNGFIYYKNPANFFSNGKCRIILRKNENGNGYCDFYEISTPEGICCSSDPNIYWLIGYLTYYGLMDKNYKQ